MTSSVATFCDNDGKTRCFWCAGEPIYVEYHDTEWGQPVAEDNRLFEKLCLEGFQAGLSWLTILKKREGFRQAFANFDIEKVARFTETKVAKLVTNEKIIRHKGKINATIQNAKSALDIQQEFGSLAAYLWQYEPANSPQLVEKTQIQAQTDESLKLSKDLKKRGFKFVGPTTCYAFMQAMGMVNDHFVECHLFEKVQQARKVFKRP